MTGIEDYPDLNGLQKWLEDIWNAALRDFAENQGLGSDPIDVFLSEVIVTGKFGKGTGEIGEDPLEVAYVFEHESQLVDTFESDDFNIATTVISALSRVIENDLNAIEGLDKTPPEPASEWFTETEILTPPTAEDRLDGWFLPTVANKPGPDRAYSITEREVLEWEESTVFYRTDLNKEVPPGEIDEVPDIQLEERPEGEIIRRQPIANEEDEGFVGPTLSVDESLDEVEELEQDNRINQPPIDIDKRSEGDTIEVPVGKKQTKQVDNRPLYDFEKEMLAMGDGGTDLEINEGIGLIMARGGLTQETPAATFPRTGFYVKNRLLHEGTTFGMQLHRDLCRYSWGIINKYELLVRPGLYDHFMEMMWKFDEAGVVRPLDQREIKERGLEVRPTGPGGVELDFLEDRKYFTVVDGMEDSDIWFDVTEHLYGD